MGTGMVYRMSMGKMRAPMVLASFASAAMGAGGLCREHFVPHPCTLLISLYRLRPREISTIVYAMRLEVRIENLP